MALLSGGGYAQYAKVNKNHIMEIPEGLDFVQVKYRIDYIKQAAGIPEAWLTAFQLINLVGIFKC